MSRIVCDALSGTGRTAGENPEHATGDDPAATPEATAATMERTT